MTQIIWIDLFKILQHGTHLFQIPNQLLEKVLSRDQLYETSYKSPKIKIAQKSVKKSVSTEGGSGCIFFYLLSEYRQNQPQPEQHQAFQVTKTHFS
jgi:hypothetical protein